MEKILSETATPTRRAVMRGLALSPVILSGLIDPARASGNVIKIGVLGVMSGPAATWGLVNKYCAEAAANLYNEEGGFEIGGKKYQVEIVVVDDKMDPKAAVLGAERLIKQEGINYIIGPNGDPTGISIQPVLESTGAMNFVYAYARDLFVPPHGNTILGMIDYFQAAPVIYKYLADKKGAKTISFVTRNESGALNQLAQGRKAAEALGLKILSRDATYEVGATDFFPIVSDLVRGAPDIIELTGANPSDAALLCKTVRELGFKGTLCAVVAQDIKVLNEVAGAAAEGFISLGGASTPEIRSLKMEKFIDAYTKVAGEWNDEAGTKVYALEMILQTLKAAGPGALQDTNLFKKAIPSFSVNNPFLKAETPLRYVGTQSYGQQRQIGVPMVVNEVHDGKFQTLFVGTVD